MRYIKVRGILRAKQGSQIPKYTNGGWLEWFLSLNLFNIGSTTPTFNTPDTTTDNNELTPIFKEPIALKTKWNPELPKTAEQLAKEDLYKKTFKETTGKDWNAHLKDIEYDDKSNLGKRLGKVGLNLAEGVGNFITNNPDMILTGAKAWGLNAVDIQGDNFGKFSNTMSKVQGVGKAIGGPAGNLISTAAGLVDTWGNVINAIGKKKLDDFSVDLELKSRMGGAYTGSYIGIDKAGDMAGKTVGTFTSAGSKNRFIAELAAILGKIAEIDAMNLDMLAMKEGDLHRNRWAIQLQGGYNLKTMFPIFSKQGGTLDTKISLVKSRKFNLVVNVDTKLVEEFKDGGSITTSEVVLEWEPNFDTVLEFKEGGEINWEPNFDDRGKLSFDDWFNSIPENYRANLYDYKKAYEVFDWKNLFNHAKDPENNHLNSVSPIADENGNYPFLKLGKIEDNPELQGEFDWYNSEEGKEHKSKFDIEYINDRYYYVPKKFKEGGKTKESDVPEIEETTQKNIIPEGALHKNKHHIENTEGLTLKGIPVVDNDGELQAEVECEEIIFNLEVTKALEERYHKFYDEETKQSEKDLLAIEAGKLLVEQILYNTDDRANLIAKCLEGGKL